MYPLYGQLSQPDAFFNHNELEKKRTSRFVDVDIIIKSKMREIGCRYHAFRANQKVANKCAWAQSQADTATGDIRASPTSCLTRCKTFARRDVSSILLITTIFYTVHDFHLIDFENFGESSEAIMSC
jgi:hypothetical protein